MEIIKGCSPDAPIIENEKGGRQSKTEYGFNLIDTDAILSLAQVLQYGASRYARDNWRKIPSEEHFNHMMIHYYAWLKGRHTGRSSLAHFFAGRMMFMRQESGEGWMNEIEIKIVPNRDPYEHIRQMLDEADKNGTHEQVVVADGRRFVSLARGARTIHLCAASAGVRYNRITRERR